MAWADTLNAWGSGWWSFMGRALFDSTVVLGAVLLIWLPLRRRMSVQFAHGLFLLVLLKLAMPLPESWPSLSWAVDVPAERLASAVATWTAGDDEPGTAPPRVEADEPIVVASAPAPEPIVVAAVEPVAESLVRPASEAAPPKARPRLSARAGLMLVWAAVSITLTFRFLRSVAATNHLVRNAFPLTDNGASFSVDFEALRKTAGVRAEVRWGVSPRLSSPAVGGLLRPTVVLPPDLAVGLTPKQLNWILLHELAHVRRGDLWVVMVQRLVSSFFFFHPVVHVANWAIDQLREYACDDTALAAAHASRRACGEGFLTIVGRTVEHASSPALGLFESRMLIRRRLLRILDARRAVHERLSPLAAVALVGLAAVLLPYGRPRTAAANLAGFARDAAPSPDAEEPRSYTPGATLLHDDRADSAGKPRSPAFAVAYAPDGKTLATAGQDAAIVLRDPATGAPRKRLESHTDAVTCLAFSPDGTTLASAGFDRTVRLWDVASGRLRSTLDGHTQWIFALAFSPGGETLASAGSDRTIRLWDVASARPTSTLTGPSSAVRALAYSPDGSTLSSAGADRVATLWDLATLAPRATLEGHRGTIRALAYSRDGRQLATAGEDAEIRLWDGRTGRRCGTLTGHADMVTSLAFSPTGATLASSGLDASLKLWDTTTGRERATLAGHSEGVLALAFAPGARQLASTGYDGTVRLWEAAAPTLAASAVLPYPGQPRDLAFASGGVFYVVGPSGALDAYDSRAVLLGKVASAGSHLALTPDGKSLALGDEAGSIRLVDAASRREVATFESHAGGVRALAFVGASDLLASGGTDGRVLARSMTPGSTPEEWLRVAGPVVALVASPGGSALAVVSGERPSEVALFNVASRKTAATFTSSGSKIAAIAFSPDGSSLAAVEDEGGVELFDVARQTQRSGWSCPAGRSVAFSPDGRFLATGHEGGEILLWSASTGRKLANLAGHSGPVSRVVFTADGRTIASAGCEGTVRLWDLGARRLTPRASLNGKVTQLGPVAVSPDGRTIASAEVIHDSLGRIVLWDARTREVRATLPGHGRGVASLAFSPDGTLLASSGCDLTIKLWDATTGEARGEFAATEGVAWLGVAPDGKTLASAGEDRALTLWDVESGAERTRIDGFRGPIYAVSFSPDGRRIATGGGLDRREGGFGEVKVFDAVTREVLADLAGHTRSIRSLAFAPDGRALATGGVDGTVRVWDVDSGKARLALAGFPDCVRAVGFSPDGRQLAAAGRGDGIVTLLDAATGGEVARLVGHGGTVLGLAFTPDGRTLATGGLDATIKLWDVPWPRAEFARR